MPALLHGGLRHGCLGPGVRSSALIERTQYFVYLHAIHWGWAVNQILFFTILASNYYENRTVMIKCLILLLLSPLPKCLVVFSRLCNYTTTAELILFILIKFICI